MVLDVAIAHADDVLHSKRLFNVTMEERLARIVVVKCLNKTAIQDDDGFEVDDQVAAIASRDGFVLRRHVLQHLVKVLPIWVRLTNLTIEIAYVLKNRMQNLMRLGILAIQLSHLILVIRQLQVHIRTPPIRTRHFDDTNPQQTDQQEQTPRVGKRHRQTDRFTELSIRRREEQDQHTNQTEYTGNTIEDGVFAQRLLNTTTDRELGRSDPRLANRIHQPAHIPRKHTLQLAHEENNNRY